MSIEVTRYRSNIPTDVTDSLTMMFERNYPPMYSEEERLRDLGRHAGDAFNTLLQENRRIYVASEAGDVAGYAEATTRPDDGGVFELLNWIMVDSPFRGHGISSLLHESFLADARRRAHGRRPVPTAALLNVHPDNPSRLIYEKWGYVYDGRETSDGKLTMRKAL